MSDIPKPMVVGQTLVVRDEDTREIVALAVATGPPFSVAVGAAWPEGDYAVYEDGTWWFQRSARDVESDEEFVWLQPVRTVAGGMDA